MHITFTYILCTVVSDKQLNITVQSVGETTIMLSWTTLVLMDDAVVYYQVMLLIS